VDGANGLAFDRAGNLYLAGSNTKTLLMIDRAGTMTLPADVSRFYPRGAGGLATAPDGSVLAMNGTAIVRLTPSGATTVLELGRRDLDGVRGFQPNGVAVARDGSVNADTWLGNGFTNATALVRIRGSRVRVLWRR
jgi:sugar lactone lactonase YvrE